MKTKFNFFDALLTAAVLGTAVFFFLRSVASPPASRGLYAAVYLDNETIMRVPLDEAREVKVKEGFILSLDGSSARVSSASCPKKICRHSGRIRSRGESLVCVPGKIVVTVEDGGETPLRPDFRKNYDAITR